MQFLGFLNFQRFIEKPAETEFQVTVVLTAILVKTLRAAESNSLDLIQQVIVLFDKMTPLGLAWRSSCAVDLPKNGPTPLGF